MNHDLSSNYLNHKLSEAEELAFEKQLHHDMIKNRYEQLLVNEGLHVPKEPPLQIVHRKKYPMWKAAAVLAVVSLAGWQVWKTQLPAKMPNLNAEVQQYLAQTAEIPQTRMGATTQNEVNWAAFKQAYAAKDYDKAIHLMEAIEPKAQDESYYYGLCYLYKGDGESMKAILHLKEALKWGKKEAAWYLALAQLKQGDTVAAKQSLQQFLGFDLDWKRAEAEVLLKKLN
ncbi:MAG: hypothetical protein RLZZ628_240 [Bacteroidota bacterium]|jgi:hypothetical protein